MYVIDGCASVCRYADFARRAASASIRWSRASSARAAPARRAAPPRRFAVADEAALLVGEALAVGAELVVDLRQLLLLLQARLALVDLLARAAACPSARQTSCGCARAAPRPAPPAAAHRRSRGAAGSHDSSARRPRRRRLALRRRRVVAAAAAGSAGAAGASSRSRLRRPPPSPSPPPSPPGCSRPSCRIFHPASRCCRASSASCCSPRSCAARAVEDAHGGAVELHRAGRRRLGAAPAGARRAARARRRSGDALAPLWRHASRRSGIRSRRSGSPLWHSALAKMSQLRGARAPVATSALRPTLAVVATFTAPASAPAAAGAPHDAARARVSPRRRAQKSTRSRVARDSHTVVLALRKGQKPCAPALASSELHCPARKSSRGWL